MFIKLTPSSYVNLATAENITIETVNKGPKYTSDGKRCTTDVYESAISIEKDLGKMGT